MRPLTGQSAYQQLAEIIRGRIEDGTYPHGQLLPKEADLGAEFGVSRVTANHAIKLLQAEGLVITRRGIGVLVTPPAEVVPLRGLLAYIETRLDAGDTVLFRRPDGTIDPINVTKTE